MNKKIVVGTAIGLVIGLAAGIFISIIFFLPNMKHTEYITVTTNQVQVSGTVSQTQTGTIQFINLNETISSSTPIANSAYSIVLLSGQSYNVYIYRSGNSYYSWDYSLYVPLGYTTFTANF